LVTTGLSEVFQQTPLEVTEAPPSLVTLPPETADIDVIAETEAVDNTGGPGFFLHDDKIKIVRIIPKVLNRFFIQFSFV
jgi:hypothetical protein